MEHFIISPEERISLVTQKNVNLFVITISGSLGCSQLT